MSALAARHRPTCLPASTASVREQFCVVLANGPLLKADAIVVLSGDGEVRLPAAVELFRSGAAPCILVTGGLDNPPHSLLASVLAGKLMGLGVAPDRILTDDASRHTQEQAAEVLEQAVRLGWRRVLLVVSPYHQYRAFLTFVRTLTNAGEAERLHVVVVPASQCGWWERPAGRVETRLRLLDEEFAKITRYREHVASYEEGLAYLRAWEGR